MNKLDVEQKLAAIREEQERIDGRQRSSASDAFLVEDHIRLSEMARRAGLPLLQGIYRARSLKSDNPERARRILDAAEQDLNGKLREFRKFSKQAKKEWIFVKSFLLTTKARVFDALGSRKKSLQHCARALRLAQSVLRSHDLSGFMLTDRQGSNRHQQDFKALSKLTNDARKWRPEELKWLVLDPLGAALLSFEKQTPSSHSSSELGKDKLLHILTKLAPRVLAASPWLLLTHADYKRETQANNPGYRRIISDALSAPPRGSKTPGAEDVLRCIRDGRGDHLPRRDRPALYAAIQNDRWKYYRSRRWEADPYLHLLHELRTNLDAIAWRRIESVIGWHDDIKKTPSKPNKTEVAHSFGGCKMVLTGGAENPRPDLTIPKLAVSRNDAELVVLRSWSSWTPLVSHGTSHPLGFRQHSRGGGYLVRWQGLGIAIDPGIGFVHNLYEADRSIGDIDLILVSHNHPDHTLDIPAILNLFHVAGKTDHTWILSKNVFGRFSNMIKDAGGEQFQASNMDVFRVNDGDVVIRALPAHHKDVADPSVDESHINSSLGFRIDLKEDGAHRRRLLFTCDTHWCEAMKSAYEGEIRDFPVDILVPHISDVFVELLSPQDTNSGKEELYRHNHLGIRGTYDVIRAVGPGIAAIGEWGQELEGYRKVIVDAIQRALARGNGLEKTRVLPADRGLVVDLKTLDVRCSYRPKRYGYDLCRAPVAVGNVTVDVNQVNGGEQIRYLCEHHAHI